MKIGCGTQGIQATPDAARHHATVAQRGDGQEDDEGGHCPRAKQERLLIAVQARQRIRDVARLGNEKPRQRNDGERQSHELRLAGAHNEQPAKASARRNEQQHAEGRDKTQEQVVSKELIHCSRYASVLEASVLAYSALGAASRQCADHGFGTVTHTAIRGNLRIAQICVHYSTRLGMFSKCGYPTRTTATKEGSAEGQSPFAGSLGVSLRYILFPLPGTVRKGAGGIVSAPCYRVAFHTWYMRCSAENAEVTKIIATARNTQPVSRPSTMTTTRSVRVTSPDSFIVTPRPSPRARM